MLTFRNTNIVVILLLTGLILLDYTIGIAFYWYLLLLFVYSLVLFYGSYYVGSNFYFYVICSAVTDKKKIAISFDDGPLPEYTPQILQVLKDQRVPATFFCIGKRAEQNKELLLQVYREGHIIGNHSYSHSPVFDLFGAKKMMADLQQMNDVTRQTLGLELRLFRPPYGVTNPNLGRAVKQGGFTAVGWNIRSLDTVSKDSDKLRKKVIKALKPGAVILFHDTCKSTADMLSGFLKEVKEQGYEIVPLDKLLNLQPYA